MFDDLKFSEMPILAILVILVLFVIGGIGGFVVGEISYEYEINKCRNLKDSNYNFDFKIEKDASYAQSCYFYNNHPLARVLTVGGLTLLGLAVMIIPYMIIHGHYDMKEFDKNLNSKGGYY